MVKTHSNPFKNDIKQATIYAIANYKHNEGCKWHLPCRMQPPTVIEIENYPIYHISSLWVKNKHLHNTTNTAKKQ